MGPASCRPAMCPPSPLPATVGEGIGVGVEVKEEMREGCEKIKIKTAYNQYMALGGSRGGGGSGFIPVARGGR